MVKINNIFSVDDFGEREDVILNGVYQIKMIKNKDIEPGKEYEQNEKLFCKSVSVINNVLYRYDTEHIEKYIDLIIRYTHHDNCSDLKLNFDVKKKEVFNSGTICPAKETCFEYENKIFIIYGRYIFAYEKPYVIFKAKNINYKNNFKYNTNNDDNSDNEKKYFEEDKEEEEIDYIREDEIKIYRPKDKNIEDEFIISDYSYVFKIIDKDTNILEAFGLYR